MLGCMPDDEKIKLRYSPEESARLIKEEARRLGFSACGFAEAQALPPSVVGTYEKFLSEGRHGEMDYLERNRELRYSPAELLPGTRTVISVALNYYPKIKQPASAPQIAYYAYGKDYHKVVKRLLDKLLDYIRREVCPSVSGRSFSDSAPIAERYWACRAGIGWVGRSGMESYWWISICLPMLRCHRAVELAGTVSRVVPRELFPKRAWTLVSV